MLISKKLFMLPNTINQVSKVRPSKADNPIWLHVMTAAHVCHEATDNVVTLAVSAHTPHLYGVIAVIVIIWVATEVIDTLHNCNFRSIVIWSRMTNTILDVLVHRGTRVSIGSVLIFVNFFGTYDLIHNMLFVCFMFKFHAW